MAERTRARSARWMRGGVVPMLLLCGGCGAAGSSTPGAAVTATSPGAATSPTSLVKPTDATQAVLDAVRRTADFKDVEWDDTQSNLSGGQRTDYANAFTATRTPPRIQNKTKPGSAGHALTTIQDLGANSLCTMPEGGPNQRFAGQGASVDTVDPFHALKVNGSGWTFLSDMDVNGHSDWRVTGAFDPGPGSGQFTVTASTIVVFVDSRSGKIESTVAHATLTQPGQPGIDRTITDTNFVYDSGATIPAC